MCITTVAVLCLAAAAPLTAQESDLHFEVNVPVSAEDAFRMWTDPAEASKFLALKVRIDPWVGGRYETISTPRTIPRELSRARMGPKFSSWNRRHALSSNGTR